MLLVLLLWIKIFVLLHYVIANNNLVQSIYLYRTFQFLHKLLEHSYVWVTTTMCLSLPSLYKFPGSRLIPALIKKQML